MPCIDFQIVNQLKLVICKKWWLLARGVKNKGYKDTMSNILNALSIFPFLCLLMGAKESWKRFRNVARCIRVKNPYAKMHPGFLTKFLLL